MTTSSEFRKARQDLLYAIELQIAQQGEVFAAPALLVQREELRRELDAIDAALKPHNDRAELLRGMDDVQRMLYIERLVMGTQVDVWETQKEAARDFQRREQRQKEIDEQYHVAEQQREEARKKIEQLRRWLIGLAVLVGLGALVHLLELLRRRGQR